MRTVVRLSAFFCPPPPTHALGNCPERPGPARGAGAAALGHPANAVAWLANTLGRLGIALEAGEVVLSGSLGIMVPVQAGDNLRVTIGGIGGCSVRFV